MDFKTKELQALEEEITKKHQITDIRRRWAGEDKYVNARIEFAVCAYKEGFRQKEISSWLGQADHSTVSRYIKAHKEGSSKLRPEYTPSKNPQKQKRGLYNKLTTFFRNLL